MEEPRICRRPGFRQSRVARAVARIYTELGLLTYGNVIEVAAADLAASTPRETGILVGEAVNRSLRRAVDDQRCARLVRPAR
jgi:hypothetical protein